MSQTLVDDDLWSRIEPLLPKRRPRNRQHAGRKPIPDRAVLTGILFVLRSGIPWKMLPQEMGCGLEATPSGLAHGVAPTGPTRSGAGRRRQRLARGAARGKKAGPNPTDRRKAGSKHHVPTDANGIPVVARITSANRNDITQLLPLVDSIPPLRGCPGRPLRKPGLVQGDRGYDLQPHRDALHRRGIATRLAKRGRPHGSGLGRTRWVIERTLAWLHRFRRLNLRYERRPCVHEAFLTLACVLVCWNQHLRPVS